jgi:hypothetical protein
MPGTRYTLDLKSVRLSFRPVPPSFADATVGGFGVNEELEGQVGLPFCVEKDDEGD